MKSANNNNNKKITTETTKKDKVVDFMRKGEEGRGLVET